MRREDTFEATGCFAAAIVMGLAIAWIGFLIWAIYTVVTWLVTQ